MNKTIQFLIVTHEKKPQVRSLMCVSGPEGGLNLFTQGFKIENQEMAAKIIVKLEVFMAELGAMCEPKDL